MIFCMILIDEGDPLEERVVSGYNMYASVIRGYVWVQKIPALRNDFIAKFGGQYVCEMPKKRDGNIAGNIRPVERERPTYESEFPPHTTPHTCIIVTDMKVSSRPRLKGILSLRCARAWLCSLLLRSSCKSADGRDGSDFGVCAVPAALAGIEEYPLTLLRCPRSGVSLPSGRFRRLAASCR